MTSDSSHASAQRPKQAIRRFDVFAEYNRLKGRQKGLDEAHAKGYGLWVAKVVASGGGRRSGATSRHEAEVETEDRGDRREQPSKQEWHELSGEPQTDKLFDREVIQRMGRDFYAHVFAPAIAEAVEQGQSYESIRDTLRKGWKPARP
jgi:hypothetical protein